MAAREARPFLRGDEPCYSKAQAGANRA